MKTSRASAASGCPRRRPSRGRARRRRRRRTGPPGRRVWANCGRTSADRPAVALHHVEHREGVQFAVPRGVLQTRLRREAHGGVDGPAVQDRAHGRAAAQVAAHQPQVLARASQDLRRTLAHVLVRRAVVAVAPHAVLLAPVGRHAVADGVLGHGRVEFRLEGGHQRHARHGVAESADAGQIDRVVRRRGGQVLLQRRDQLVVDHERAAIARAGQHGLEGHGVDAGRRSRFRRWRRGSRGRAPGGRAPACAPTASR